MGGYIYTYIYEINTGKNSHELQECDIYKTKQIEKCNLQAGCLTILPPIKYKINLFSD